MSGKFWSAQSTIYINNRFHLVQNINAWIVVCQHYLFRNTNTFQEPSSEKTVSFNEKIMFKDLHPSL